MDKGKLKPASEWWESVCVVTVVPPVHSSQCGVSEAEEFGVDDGEHELTAAMAVTQRTLEQLEQAGGQQERWQERRVWAKSMERIITSTQMPEQPTGSSM